MARRRILGAIFEIRIKFAPGVSEAEVREAVAKVEKLEGVWDVQVRAVEKPTPKLRELPPREGWRLSPDQLRDVRERVVERVGRPLNEAEDFLFTLLVDCELFDAKSATALAESAGFGEHQVRRARETLDITARKAGFQGESLWSPPDWWGVPNWSEVPGDDEV